MNKAILDSLIDEPILLMVVEHEGVEHRLEARSVTLHTLLKLQKLIGDLEQKGTVHETVMSNVEIARDYLAIAVHNKPTPVPAWITDVIENQLSLKQLSKLIEIVYRRLGIEDFFIVLGLMRKSDIMPENTQEVTAPKPL